MLVLQSRPVGGNRPVHGGTERLPIKNTSTRYLSFHKSRRETHHECDCTEHSRSSDSSIFNESQGQCWPVECRLLTARRSSRLGCSLVVPSCPPSSANRPIQLLRSTARVSGIATITVVSIFTFGGHEHVGMSPTPEDGHRLGMQRLPTTTGRFHKCGAPRATHRSDLTLHLRSQ